MKSIVALGLMLACPLASLAADAAAVPSTPVRRFQAMTGIDGAGWKLLQETPTLIGWETPDGMTVSIAVNDRNLVRDAYFTEQVAAQDRFRANAERHHGGLVEVVVRQGGTGTPYDIETSKYKADHSDGKTPGAPNMYIMSTWFLLSPQSMGAISIGGHETASVGSREAKVAHAIAATKVNDGMARHDPYDARFDASALYVEADDRRWDSLAPTHPLSQMRALEVKLLAKSKLPGVAESVAGGLVAPPAAK